MKYRLLASITTLLVATAFTACGSDGSKATDGDGGARGTGGAEGDDASTGNGGGQNGDGGGSASEDAGPITPGTLASIWKRSSTHITAIDSANPTGIIQGDVAIPAVNDSEEFDGRAADIYQQIKDDTLITYAFLAGDSVYYKVSRPLLSSGDTYVINDGQSATIYQLTDGQLTETFTSTASIAVIYMESTFSAYKGTFPPKGWPQKEVTFE